MTEFKEQEFFLVEFKNRALYIKGSNLPIINRTKFTRKWDLENINNPVQISTKIIPADVTNDTHYQFKLKAGEYAVIDPKFNEKGLSGYKRIIYNSSSPELTDMAVAEALKRIVLVNKYSQQQTVLYGDDTLVEKPFMFSRDDLLKEKYPTTNFNISELREEEILAGIFKRINEMANTYKDCFVGSNPEKFKKESDIRYWKPEQVDLEAGYVVMNNLKLFEHLGYTVYKEISPYSYGNIMVGWEVSPTKDWWRKVTGHKLV